MDLKVVSYNCRSLKSDVATVHNLCDLHDIVLLQETWLWPSELHLVSSLHSDFEGSGISSMANDIDIRVGRPYGGLAIMWRKSLSGSVSFVPFHDRAIGSFVTCAQGVVLIVNVYMPYDAGDADSSVSYSDYLGRLAGLICTSNFDHLIIMGDFNADSRGSRFFSELQSFCSDHELACTDSAVGDPSNHFTYVSSVTFSTSWLDHCLCANNTLGLLACSNILYNEAFDDHIPLSCSWNLDVSSSLSIPTSSPSTTTHCVQWGDLTPVQKGNFTSSVSASLSNRSDFSAICYCANSCSSPEHTLAIDDLAAFFRDTVLLCSNQLLLRSSTSSVSRQVRGWNDFVDSYHKQARADFLSWRKGGSPKSGPLLDNMRSSRQVFKSQLRKCRSAKQQTELEALSLAKSCADNGKKFWAEVSKLNRVPSPLPSVVDGVVGEKAIAERWRLHYTGLFAKVNTAMPSVPGQAASQPGPSSIFTVWDVKKAIGCLSSGKAGGSDNIRAEHLKLLDNYSIVWLTVLLNSMVSHSFVPGFMCSTVVSPIIKNKNSSAHDIQNYRGIAVTSVLSKLLESLIQDRISSSLTLHPAQFGFKSDHSTIDAIFVLKETIRHFRDAGSNVYCAFLDLSHAFDRVRHDLLFCYLRDRGIPPDLLNLLSYWYTNQQGLVKWGAVRSDPFPITSGVRQGGLLSPLFFNVYVDKLLYDLEQSRHGCVVGDTKISVLAYADDLVLVSPTRSGLQELLNIADNWALAHDMNFNVRKSCCMICHSVARDRSSAVPLRLKGGTLSFVSCFKYLGCLISSTLCESDDIARAKRSFISSFYVLIQKFKGADKEILVQLFQTFCCNLYGAPLWIGYSAADIRSLAVLYHKAIKRLAGVPMRSRNHETCHELGVLSFEALYGYLFLRLYDRLSHSFNPKVAVFIHNCTLAAKPFYQKYLSIRENLNLMDLDLGSSSFACLKRCLKWHVRQVALS